MEKKKSSGALYAVLGAVSWGFSGTASQYLFMNYELNSIWVTSMRMTLSGIVLILACFCVSSKRAELVALLRHKHDFFHEILFALAGLMFVQAAYLTAIEYSNSATATVLQNLSVAFIAIFTAVRTKTMLSRVHIFSILLALFGVFLLATHGNIRTMVLSAQGLFWGVMAAVGVCTYSLLSAGLVVRWDAAVVSAYGMLIGGVVLGLSSRAFFMPAALDITGWFVLALIVLIGTVGAFTLFIKGIGEIGAVKATLIGCLEPVSATIISALWLGSKFSLIDIAGFACILITVFLFTLHKE
ncbi:MAG: DMT family transporter [Eubacteriales bacterium]|nr:DMT family transporter [Eubacteriales bacterium]